MLLLLFLEKRLGWRTELLSLVMLAGEPLPMSDAQRTDTDADLLEPIYLLLQTGQQLSRQVTVPAL